MIYINILNLKYIIYKMVDTKQDYLTKHLFNYIGNKRNLLSFINETLVYVKEKLNKDLISSLDGFSGSGSVARLLKYHSDKLYVNDLEHYSYIINTAYLTNPDEKEMEEIEECINMINELPKTTSGIISKLYSPKDDNNIQDGERVFYTNENAKIIDSIRNEIDNLPEDKRIYIMAQLLIKSSVHVNTSGVFKGFYKDSKTKRGKFGGNGENALQRIKGKIILDMPLFSEQEHKVEVNIFNEDINTLIKDKNKMPIIDIAYFDPPYNQHPYGSNYFMLNVIAKNKQIENKDISEVSGIVKNWNKSEYNYKNKANKAMKDLIKNTRARYILISYNNEGIIPENEWIAMLDDLKYPYEKRIKKYNTFRASRNLKKREKYIEEIIWIIDKTELYN